MDVTLTGCAEPFGAGTKVHCYRGSQPPFRGAPPGEPVASAVVKENGDLTFKGLAPNVDHIAYAADRYVRFLPSE